MPASAASRRYTRPSPPTRAPATCRVARAAEEEADTTQVAADGKADDAKDADAKAKKDDEKAPQAFINPEITWSSEEMKVHEEGCLSIPEYYEEVERPAKVRVKYLDLDGKLHEVEADGILATCLQHEIDHLNGVLFIDHLSKLKRDRVIKKYTKIAKQAAD